MIRDLASLFLLFSLAFNGCSSPPIEITITTRTPSYQGLIFVGGNVNNPGIYPFSSEDHLSDLIEAAGGLREGADATQVELSFGPKDINQKIDLNRAEAWLLEALPEIGSITSHNIVLYRETYGNFLSINDLLKIPGIGPATLTKIADFVTVGGE